MEYIQEVLEQETHDNIIYFMPADEVLQRLRTLQKVFSLTDLSPEVSGGNGDSWWLNLGEHTIVMSRLADGIEMEIFNANFHEVNELNIEPLYCIFQGWDDNSWTTEYVGDKNNNFDELTQIFYYKDNEIFAYVFDTFFYDGGDVPDDFTPENVLNILSHHD